MSQGWIDVLPRNRLERVEGPKRYLAQTLGEKQHDLDQMGMRLSRHAAPSAGKPLRSSDSSQQICWLVVTQKMKRE